MSIPKKIPSCDMKRNTQGVCQTKYLSKHNGMYIPPYQLFKWFRNMLRTHFSAAVPVQGSLFNVLLYSHPCDERGWDKSWLSITSYLDDYRKILVGMKGSTSFCQLLLMSLVRGRTAWGTDMAAEAFQSAQEFGGAWMQACTWNTCPVCYTLS